MTGPFYFEDMPVGSVFHSRAVVMERDRIVAFAREFDPQPGHVSEDTAALSQFGRLVASGWHTCAVTMRLLCDTLPVPGGNIGTGADVKWLRPVVPGDALRIEIEILAARVSNSRPDRGVITTRTTTLNGRDEPVQTMVSSQLVPRRPAD